MTIESISKFSELLRAWGERGRRMAEVEHTVDQMLSDLEARFGDVSQAMWICVHPSLADKFREYDTVLHNKDKGDLDGQAVLLGGYVVVRMAVDPSLEIDGWEWRPES
jgi:hypothetical protein